MARESSSSAKSQFIVALQKTEQLAPAPRTLSRVLQLLSDADSGLYAIAELLNFDSALAVEVLRCANSAYYSRGSRVSAIGEAVHVIGFHETIRVVSLAAIRQTTHCDLANYGIAAEDFWAESLFNGLFLEALARRTGSVRPSEAYTTGLLRFVGRLAINQTIQELGAGMFWDGKRPLLDWEREQVGITQSEAGAMLLKKWQFADAIVDAVALQDTAPAAIDHGHQPLASAENLAAQVLPAGLRKSAIEEEGAQLLPLPENHPFAREHRLTADLLADLREEARAEFVAIREHLYGE